MNGLLHQGQAFASMSMPAARTNASTSASKRSIMCHHRHAALRRGIHLHTGHSLLTVRGIAGSSSNQPVPTWPARTKSSVGGRDETLGLR
jgi:hypothetical protein